MQVWQTDCLSVCLSAWPAWPAWPACLLVCVSVCSRVYVRLCARQYVGVVQNYFAWGPPNRRPIAVQSRSHNFQSRSHVGHSCCVCFGFHCLISSAGSLPSLEGSDIARIGRASLVKLVQSPSNRRPTAVQSRNSSEKLRFAASSLCQ